MAVANAGFFFVQSGASLFVSGNFGQTGVGTNLLGGDLTANGNLEFLVR